MQFQASRVATREFLAEAAHHLDGVESKRLGVAAHEIHGVGAGGDLIEPLGFDRFEVDATDLEIAGDVRELPPATQPLGPQGRADAVEARRAGRVARSGTRIERRRDVGTLLARSRHRVLSEMP
jgi:hypothetical protein